MKKVEDPEERAEELLTSWINGNRKDVMKALTAMSSMRAACVAAQIIDKMHHMVDGECRSRIDDFIRMMRRRLE